MPATRTPACRPERIGTSSRPPLERMLKLHHRLQSRRFPNCRKLSEELEVSAKTIQRDIDFMRYRLELPIEYDPLRFGYFYSEPVTNFPSIEVSEGEIVALFVAQKALSQYRGTSFEKPLKAAFKKMTDGLKDDVTFEWEDVESSISFRGIGTSMADINLFETVSKAVLRSEEISFRYRKLKSASYETRRAQPYHLGCIENQWYLFAHDLTRRQLRTFALPRMREVKNSGTHFRRPANFSIGNYLSGSFGVFSGQSRQLARIRFDAFAARLVGERQWHVSQKLKPLADGALEMTFELGSLEEIERWILSWGEHARVLEPPALVARIQQATAAMQQAYAAK